MSFAVDANVVVNCNVAPTTRESPIGRGTISQADLGFTC
jgi:hypothetical protein